MKLFDTKIVNIVIWLIWCPVGGLVGGCGTWAVSRKTPINFIVQLETPEKTKQDDWDKHGGEKRVKLHR